MKRSRPFHVADLFGWPSVLLTALVALLGEDALRQSILCADGGLLVTHFSGIGTVEAGLHYMREACARMFDFRIGLSCTESADIEESCRGVLLHMTHDCCVRGDILDVLGASLAQVLRHEHIDDQILEAVKGGINIHPWCYRHDDFCSLVSPTIMMAGSPCVDWSGMGCRGKEHGKKFSCLLAWLMCVLFLMPPLVIHENVLGFDTTLFDRVLGQYYVIVLLTVRTAHVAFGRQTRRVRRYAVMTHKVKAIVVYPIAQLYEEVTAHFQDLEHRSVPSFCVERPAGLLVAKRQRMQQLKTSDAACHLHFRDLLTPLQSGRLRFMCRLWARMFGIEATLDSRALFHLGDDPWKRLIWSGSVGCLPTLRRGMGPIWSPSLGRWITAVELLTAMGFVAHPEVSARSGLQPHLPQRFLQDSTSVVRAVGNAMHLVNAAVVLAVSAACVRIL